MLGDSFVWLQLISSYRGVRTTKCRVRVSDRGHLLVSGGFKKSWLEKGEDSKGRHTHGRRG